MNNCENILQMLETVAGIDRDSYGTSSLKNSLNFLMQERNIKSEAEYYNLLNSDPACLRELINHIVVPESWFMRNEKAFIFFKEHLMKLMPSDRADILSIPCASGEEPYSLMFVLADLPFVNYSISAIDISSNALEKARKAIYTESSLRDSSPSFKDRFFIKEGKTYQLKPQYIKNIDFKEGNILADDFSEHGFFDVIFCKNLLIYFNKRARVKALENLKKVMKPEALLFVGHTEMHFFAQNGFESLDVPGAFVVKQKTVVKKANHPKKKTLISAVTQKHILKKTPDIKSQAEPARKDRKKIYEELRQIADSGQFENAEKLLAEMDSDELNKPEILFLQGLIEQASNRLDNAAEFFSKTIYLVPEHYEAMIHLSYIFDIKGDKKKAELLRMRAQRCNVTIKTSEKISEKISEMK